MGMKNWSYSSSKKNNLTKNWSYTIKEGEHAGKTLWSGRYCAVVGIVIYYDLDTDITYILATKRGKGTPDYKGYWCMPCGFLEADESGEQGVAREVFEETGIKYKPELFYLYGVQTEPELCNNGNVTLRYYNIVDEITKPNYVNINGEVDEVEEVKWIPVTEIDNYIWAFGHDDLIKNMFE